MPYLSGLNNKDGRLIIIKESDWSVEINDVLTASPDAPYEREVSDSGARLVVFILDDGEVKTYGNVTPSETSINT